MCARLYFGHERLTISTSSQIIRAFVLLWVICSTVWALVVKVLCPEVQMFKYAVYVTVEKSFILMLTLYWHSLCLYQYLIHLCDNFWLLPCHCQSCQWCKRYRKTEKAWAQASGCCPAFPLHLTASLTPSFAAVGDVRSQQPGSGDLQGGEYYDFQAPIP